MNSIANFESLKFEKEHILGTPLEVLFIKAIYENSRSKIYRGL